MFQNLRQSSLFYVLDKSEKPVLRVGQVVSVSQPTPKYGTSYQNQFATEMVVDITVKIGDETREFKQVPSQLSIANFGQAGVVISESREAMNAEVESMMRTSKQVIDSVDYHKSVIESCEGILRDLNPQLAKEKEQEERINRMEDRLCNMDAKFDKIMGALSKIENKKNV